MLYLNTIFLMFYKSSLCVFGNYSHYLSNKFYILLNFVVFYLLLFIHLFCIYNLFAYLIKESNDWLAIS